MTEHTYAFPLTLKAKPYSVCLSHTTQSLALNETIGFLVFPHYCVLTFDFSRKNINGTKIGLCQPVAHGREDEPASESVVAPKDTAWAGTSGLFLTLTLSHFLKLDKL